MQVCPLHSAVATADPDVALHMAQVLIAKGADVNATQQGANTPLHEAAQRGHADLIDLLLAAGADRRLRNDEGDNAVDLACMAGHHHLADKLAPGPVW
jgi:ankyrin repeat protein